VLLVGAPTLSSAETDSQPLGRLRSLELRIDAAWSTSTLRVGADRSIRYEARSLGIIYYKGRRLDRGATIQDRARLTDAQVRQLAESLRRNRFYVLSSPAPQHLADGLCFSMTAEVEPPKGPVARHVASGCEGAIAPQLMRVVDALLDAWKALGMELIMDPGT
jgi:hypothetical protein